MTREERESIAREWLPRVRAIARRMLHSQSLVDADCLESAGMLGVARALDRFDPSRGYPLGSWIAQSVYNAIQDELRYNRPVSSVGKRLWSKLKAHADSETPPTEVTHLRFVLHGLRHAHVDSSSVASPELNPEEQNAHASERAWLRKNLCRLTPEVRRVVVALLRGYTHAQAARALGVSESRISQAAAEATRTLRAQRLREERFGPIA